MRYIKISRYLNSAAYAEYILLKQVDAGRIIHLDVILVKVEICLYTVILKQNVKN